jgi:hypothetical protein
VPRLSLEHRPGVHCGSTALAGALRARGLELSEAMAFGLGAGLGCYYLASPALSPSHQIIGRSAGLERTACELLGAPCLERTADDATTARQAAAAALARGSAPILSTELSSLPYWRTRTPFGGHRVLLCGLDEARGTALLSDTDRPRLEEVPLETLDRAREAIAPPFGATGRPWLEIDAPPAPRPLADVIRDALRRQASDMLLDRDGNAGASALERLAAELPEWPAGARDEADRAWCFRFAYQVIEVRGTGGGFFRRLYASFLAEAEAALPALRPLGLATRMEDLAARWTRLAGALREAGDAPGAGVAPAGLALARELAAAERRFCEDVAARAP